MKTKHAAQFYSLLYPCGLHCTYADTGAPVVTAYRFDTKFERNGAVDTFTAPNHQPNACMIHATASNPIIRRALRPNINNFCHVFEWESSSEELRQRVTNYAIPYRTKR